MPPKQPSPEEQLSFDQEFQQELDQLEQFLVELKQRYTEVHQAEREKSQLQAQVKDLQAQPATPKTELQKLQKQLENLEVILESRLLKWSSFKEPFWQIVRFGGLGIVLGWILHSLLHR